MTSARHPLGSQAPGLTVGATGVAQHAWHPTATATATRTAPAGRASLAKAGSRGAAAATAHTATLATVATRAATIPSRTAATIQTTIKGLRRHLVAIRRAKAIWALSQKDSNCRRHTMPCTLRHTSCNPFKRQLDRTRRACIRDPYLTNGCMSSHHVKLSSHSNPIK